MIMTEILEEVSEINLEDLDHYWMENGLPVFIANRPDICNIVEDMGFQIYYLLTNNVKTVNKTTTNSQTKVTTNTPVTTKSMQLFKVVNNFVGRSVSLSNDPFDDNFVQVDEEALYTMPAIPIEIIEKLDQFFRLVDAQHGTESIVMLTYDTDKEGSEGWGVLVPDQHNTSVHCNYDPNSIAEIKPDNVMIVGSVHSHPNMSAYASGTDHEDQADFDGIHITYGWQKSVNNGATQYHIELQMSGKAYTLKPEDVFENYFVDQAPDPEVVEWTNKVKKVSPPTWGVHNTAHTPHLPAQQTGAAQQTTTSGTNQSNSNFYLKKIDGLALARERFGFKNLVIEKESIIVAELDFDNKKFVNCPICNALLDDFNVYNGYCDECYIPICNKNTSIGSIVASLGYYCADMIMDSDVPVYLWTIDEDRTESLMKIVETTLTAYLSDEIAASEISDKYDLSSNPLTGGPEEDDYTYCCQKKIEIPCDCNPRITIDDLLKFDEATKSVHLYSNTSGCSGCELFYDYSCPRWQSKAIDYAITGELNLENLKHSINDDGCISYVMYSRLNDTYLYSE